MNPQRAASAGRRRPHPGRLWGLFAATAVVSMAVLAHALWDGREQILRQAEAHGSTLAGLLASRVATTLQRVDADLERIAGSLQGQLLQPGGARQRVAGIEDQLADQVAGFPELLRIVVLDAERAVVYRSDPGLARDADLVERRVLAQLKEWPRRHTAFSEVLTTGIDGRAAIVIARALTAPDGRLLGTVHALFDLGQMQQLIESVDVGNRGAVGVRRRDDNRLLLRRPQAGAEVNRSLDSPMWQRVARGDAAGTVRMASVLDGVARVQSFRALADYPFYVVVAIAQDEVLAGWRRGAWRNAGMAGIALAVFGVLLVGLYRAERRRDLALDDLARSGRELRVAATAFEAQEAIAITDERFAVLRVNRAYARITGFAAEEVVGRDAWHCHESDAAQAPAAPMLEALARDGFWAGEANSRRKSGAIFSQWLTVSAVRDDADRVTHYVIGFTDMSERKAAEERIHTLAFYDPLTRLPNRRLLIDRIQHAMSVSARSQAHAALLFLDLDHFKILNDTRGHAIGDLVLLTVAERLRGCVRASDTVARQGGDEFLVLLEGLDADAERASAHAGEVGEKIRLSLAGPCRLDATAHHGSASLGVCLFRGHEIDLDELLKRVDTAMYQAKQAGRNTLRFFDPAMQAALEQRAALEGQLREAVARRQFALHYQLQVDSGGRVIGAEALLRWHHPQRGMVAPAEFISLAEETGCIVDIGQWVIDTACQQLARWAASAATRRLRLAVNVSARQFRQEGFVDGVRQALRRSGARAAQLELELTESTVMHDVDDAVAKMKALRALGVNFAVDDFGTGHSSLAYVQRLPLDQLKIDRSFVRELPGNVHSAAIVRSILTLAQTLGLRVIAEGVETAAQRDKLQELGCEAFQGYLFARPLPIEACVALLREPGRLAGGLAPARPLPETST